MESAAAQLAAAAMQESDVGNFKEAQQLAARSLKLARTRVVLAAAALAYAQAGNIHQAQALVDELGRRYPSHTFAKLLWIPNIQAIVAMQQGDSSRAVEILQTTSPVELGNANMVRWITVSNCDRSTREARLISPCIAVSTRQWSFARSSIILNSLEEAPSQEIPW